MKNKYSDTIAATEKCSVTLSELPEKEGGICIDVVTVEEEGFRRNHLLLRDQTALAILELLSRWDLNSMKPKEKANDTSTEVGKEEEL